MTSGATAGKVVSSLGTQTQRCGYTETVLMNCNGK